MYRCSCAGRAAADELQGNNTQVSASRPHSCAVDSQTICWLNLSQQPEIMQLQRQLYNQLHQDNEEMPTKAQKSIENQLRELRKIAAKRLILVVLDGWYSGVFAGF